MPAICLGGEGCLLKQLHKLGDGAAGGLGLHPALQFLHSKPLMASYVVTIRAREPRLAPQEHRVTRLVIHTAGDD